MEIALFFFKTTVSLFAVMDPIGAVPLMVAMTSNNTEAERRAMVRRGVITAFLVLMFFGLTQLWLFNFFGFTLGAFRVAGGLFLMVIAFEMLTAKTVGDRQSEEEKLEGIAKEDISITPLAVPLLAGPATITNVVLAFGDTKGLLYDGLVALSVLVVCAASWLILRGSGWFRRVLGTTGIKVITRMMGLILAAMAIQVTADGLSDLFPVLRGVR